MKTGIFKIIYKTLLFMLPVPVAFELLFHTGFYPIITDSTPFDLKVITLQKHPVKSIKLMAIGSSITLYELNSAILEQNLHVPYYNFASWSLVMADSRVLLNCFVKDYHPGYVVICSSIGDFSSAPNNTYSNYTSTNSWIRHHLPEYFYLKDYHSLHQIIRRKYNTYPVDFDNYGGATIKIPKGAQHKADIAVNFPNQYTPGEYQQLDSLSAMLKNKNIKLIFIQAPLRASYANKVLSQEIITAHFNHCRSIVESHNGIYLNYHNTRIFSDSLFEDQNHLTPAGSVVLTHEIVADLKKIIK